MTTELFPSEAMASPSPRLVWLKQHNLALGELPDGTRFIASANSIHHGETHRDCEESWAAAEQEEHWSVTEFNKAIAPTQKTIDIGE